MSPVEDTDMFLRFASQEERREHGGSCFIELQYCRLPVSTPLKKTVAVRSVEHWKDDSLYVDAFSEQNSFCAEYSRIFSDGVYSDLRRGVFDPNGINYYDPTLTRNILRRVLEEKPTDWERLSDWLQTAADGNGFYILGV